MGCVLVMDIDYLSKEKVSWRDSIEVDDGFEGVEASSNMDSLQSTVMQRNGC